MLRVIDRLVEATRQAFRPELNIDYEERVRFEERNAEIQARLLALKLKADIIGRREPPTRRRITRSETPK